MPPGSVTESEGLVAVPLKLMVNSGASESLVVKLRVASALVVPEKFTTKDAESPESMVVGVLPSIVKGVVAPEEVISKLPSSKVALDAVIINVVERGVSTEVLKFTVAPDGIGGSSS